MKNQEELNKSYEATRKLVIEKHKETGVYVDGFYTEFFEMSKSGRAYKIDQDDRVLYVACSACITDGNGYVFIPFTAVESALNFANRNGIFEYIGG